MEETKSTDGALLLRQEGIEFVSLPQEGPSRCINGSALATDEEDEDESQDEDEDESEIDDSDNDENDDEGESYDESEDENMMADV